MAKEIVTYSSLRTFRDCRQKHYWRYVASIVPQKEDLVLPFGRVIHEALRIYHETGDVSLATLHISVSMPTDIQRDDQLKAIAMINGYSKRWEPIEALILEKKFEGEIINPATGWESRKHILAGRIDGVVKLASGIYLIEHKTASQIDGGYIERLWCDFQIILYVFYVQKYLGILIDGVLYNVLCKPQIRRYGISQRRSAPETDEEFSARLAEKCAEPCMYHRETIYISNEQVQRIQAELWELSISLLDAKRRNVWYQNPTHCFHYNKPCPYWRLCIAEPDARDLITKNFYTFVPPHEELREDTDTES